MHVTNSRVGRFQLEGLSIPGHLDIIKYIMVKIDPQDDFHENEEDPDGYQDQCEIAKEINPFHLFQTFCVREIVTFQIVVVNNYRKPDQIKIEEFMPQLTLPAISRETALSNRSKA